MTLAIQSLGQTRLRENQFLYFTKDWPMNSKTQPNTSHGVQLPEIDVNVPEHLETATFALG